MVEGEDKVAVVARVWREDEIVVMEGGGRGREGYRSSRELEGRRR